MRVLQIGSDRSKRGILFSGTPAHDRQRAYADAFGQLDIIAFSRVGDGASDIDAGTLRIYPTKSKSRFAYGIDALRIAKKLSKPDIVSVQDPFETGLVGYFIARRFGVPLHVQIHTDFLSPEYARLSLLNRLRVHIAHFVLKRASGIRVVSERIKHSLASRWHIPASITVLPIFVDLGLIRHAIPSPDLIARFATFETKLLYVGRLEPEKNVALAIRAFAQSAPQNACLIIVGSGSQYQRLGDVAKRENVQHRVFFMGGKEAVEFYAIADLVLVPSLYDGYGLVIIEALAAGKPVLSIDVGIAKEAGAIVASKEKFADALAEWFAQGSREGHLNSYPYANFNEYVRAYCADIERCVTVK